MERPPGFEVGNPISSPADSIRASNHSAQGCGHDNPITTPIRRLLGRERQGRVTGAGGTMSPSGGRHVRGGFVSVGMGIRWIWFREVNSPCWERCRGHEPREDVRDSTSPSRLEEERTHDGMSILEGGCKAMRGIIQARNGPGKLRAGIHQGPCSKDVGGAARPEQRLLRADRL